MITDITFFFLPSALTFVLLVGYIFKLGDFFQEEVICEAELKLLNEMLKEKNYDLYGSISCYSKRWSIFH